MLLREPRAPIAPNARGQTGSLDVQEDRGEIDTGGTHRPTGVEKEDEEEPLGLEEGIVTGPEAVIEVDQVELEGGLQELHRQEEEQHPQIE